MKAAATALTTAQQVFFLENGQYACNFDDLSLEIPSQANCYIVLNGCSAWGCSLKKNNVEQITYYVEAMNKYCVVWDGTPSLLHDICKSDTGRTSGQHSSGGYTEYAY